jgi:ATP-dependent RNA helicase SUPV3L1/SUV3
MKKPVTRRTSAQPSSSSATASHSKPRIPVKAGYSFGEDSGLPPGVVVKQRDGMQSAKTTSQGAHRPHKGTTGAPPFDALQAGKKKSGVRAANKIAPPPEPVLAKKAPAPKVKISAPTAALKPSNKVTGKKGQTRDQETLSHLPTRLDGFYPKARAMKRKLTLVVGPTNSGKTHRALERLKAAQSGVYLGPLRLLALEVRDRLLDMEIPTSLVTGELIEEIEGAKFISATVEMVNFDDEIEVAVIDEVQMVGDEERGSAWLQAILGAPAREVWMLGAPEAKEAVLALAEWMGEPVEIIELERLTPYEVLQTHTKLGDLPPGSAVVAFSRGQVIDIAGELRDRFRRSPALVYGALSPEVRREQARQFREGEADILVCTDAVGLGLNLPIAAMFFSTSTKYNGKEEIPVPKDLVWQIAGRAGRYGMGEHGQVGALSADTLSFVKRSLSKRPEKLPVAFRYEANWIIVEALSKFLQTDKLADILFYFWRELQLERSREFEPVVPPSQVGLAWRVDRYPLSLRVKLMLSRAPVPMIRDEAVPEFEQFVASIAREEPILLGATPMLQARLQMNDHQNAEQAVKLLTLYCWLHYRLPRLFPEFEEAQVEMSKLNTAILGFIGKNKGKKCRECGKALPWQSKYRICDPCYRNS